MAGKWLYRYADQHQCDKPKLQGWGGEERAGDIWQCDCGKKWIIREEQRDGKYWTETKPEDLRRIGF